MMNYDDLLRLTVWNSNYNLRSGTYQFDFPDEVNWKRSILGRLGAIFQGACPTAFINLQFINSAIELFMIYQHSAAKINSTNHLSWWNPLTQVLDLCKTAVNPLAMHATGFVVSLSFKSCQNFIFLLRKHQLKAVELADGTTY